MARQVRNVTGLCVCSRKGCVRCQVGDESAAVLTPYLFVTLLFSATNPLSPNCISGGRCGMNALHVGASTGCAEVCEALMMLGKVCADT